GAPGRRERCRRQGHRHPVAARRARQHGRAACGEERRGGRRLSGPGEGQRRPASRAGSRAGGFPRGQLLLRKDPGVAGSAPEDLGADPILLATAGAASTAPVRALVDAAEVPARHVAGRTLAEGMDARRDDVADRNNGNNQNRYHDWYSLLTPTRTARSPGTAFHTGRVPRSGEGLATAAGTGVGSHPQYLLTCTE